MRLARRSPDGERRSLSHHDAGHRGGPWHGPEGDAHPRRRGGGGRRQRGDVRTAVLMLLAQEPMHGYQLMEAIADRSGGHWRPSPGAVYPTLNQLEDEGVITLTAAGGRRLAELTEDGRALVDRESAGWADPFRSIEPEEDGVDLRGELHRLHEAARVAGRTGSTSQKEQVARIVATARRDVYLVLAGEPVAGLPSAARGEVA